MKIFLDTANIEHIKEVASFNIIDGVTTNPSLISKEELTLKDSIKIISNLVKGPISAEVLGDTSEEMIKEALEYSKLGSNIVIKLPMTEEGIKACKELSEKNIKTNVTLIFTSSQALLAAKAGATYVSPFVGRLDDIKQDGVQLIKDIKDIFNNYKIKSEIIAASIRNLEHVNKVALAGTDIATIPYKVFKQMFNHELTTKGIAKFKEDSCK